MDSRFSLLSLEALNRRDLCWFILARGAYNTNQPTINEDTIERHTIPLLLGLATCFMQVNTQGVDLSDVH